jgi:Leucine-rich repeat (LRR) protein
MYLDCSYNNIKSLPKNLILNNLTEIDLNNNKIDSLNGIHLWFPVLETVDLSDNPL